MSKTAVLATLREKIHRLEGLPRQFAKVVSVCDAVDKALPCNGLPLGGVHEVESPSLANAIAFSSLLSNRISRKGAILYVAPDRTFYPLGLVPMGIQLQQWIHVSAKRQTDLHWATLEAIRCPQVNAVVAVMEAADLTFCRRLQLAAESSGATGFLIHRPASSIASAVTRWRISPVKGPPGKGSTDSFWKLELLYCRGGQPGKWVVAWRRDRLEALSPLSGVVSRPPVRQIELASENILAG